MTITVSKKYTYFSFASMGTVSKFSLQTKDAFIAYVIRNMSVAYSGDNPLVWEWGEVMEERIDRVLWNQSNFCTVR